MKTIIKDCNRGLYLPLSTCGDAAWIHKLADGHLAMVAYLSAGMGGNHCLVSACSVQLITGHCPPVTFAMGVGKGVHSSRRCTRTKMGRGKERGMCIAPNNRARIIIWFYTLGGHLLFHNTNCGKARQSVLGWWMCVKYLSTGHGEVEPLRKKAEIFVFNKRRHGIE